jgi:hypothetical protein
MECTARGSVGRSNCSTLHSQDEPQLWHSTHRTSRWGRLLLNLNSYVINTTCPARYRLKSSTVTNLLLGRHAHGTYTQAPQPYTPAWQVHKPRQSFPLPAQVYIPLLLLCLPGTLPAPAAAPTAPALPLSQGRAPAYGLDPQCCSSPAIAGQRLGWGAPTANGSRRDFFASRLPEQP